MSHISSKFIEYALTATVLEINLAEDIHSPSNQLLVFLRALALCYEDNPRIAHNGVAEQKTISTLVEQIPEVQGDAFDSFEKFVEFILSHTDKSAALKYLEDLVDRSAAASVNTFPGLAKDIINNIKIVRTAFQNTPTEHIPDMLYMIHGQEDDQDNQIDFTALKINILKTALEIHQDTEQSIDLPSLEKLTAPISGQEGQSLEAAIKDIASIFKEEELANFYKALERTIYHYNTERCQDQMDLILEDIPEETRLQFLEYANTELAHTDNPDKDFDFDSIAFNPFADYFGLGEGEPLQDRIPRIIGRSKEYFASQLLNETLPSLAQKYWEQDSQKLSVSNSVNSIGLEPKGE